MCNCSLQNRRSMRTIVFSALRRTPMIVMFVIIGSITLSAQEQSTVLGGGVVYQLPLGSLHDRYLPVTGGMVFAGIEVTPHVTWIGKIESAEFSTMNSSALKKSVMVGSGTTAQEYKLPLPKLTMNLKTIGVAAEAQMSLLRSDLLDANGVIGFGFTHWINTRGEYYDSLFINDASSGMMVKVAELAVPVNRQEDWSGTFNLGIELSAAVVDPIWIYVGAEYKMIVGELWQTLDLDLENVAGMQFVSLRAGLKAKL